jgi:hypothetical protein
LGDQFKIKSDSHHNGRQVGQACSVPQWLH